MNGKIYLRNPYLKDLEGKIIRKQKKNNKYHIILNRTIFYPRHSESDNFDKGTLNGFKVIDVFEDNGKVIHVVEENIDSKDITMKIDWNLRFDFMQQHTGQHILSVSMENLCGANTLDINFDENYSYITIDFKNLTNLDIDRIEKYANHVVYSNFQINSNDLQKKSDTKRTISIDNINTTECEGIHCSSTGEVGAIKIIDFKENEEGNIEVKFVCGVRALNDYNLKQSIINDIIGILSVREKDLPSKIEAILEENKKLKD